MSENLHLLNLVSCSMISKVGVYRIIFETFLEASLFSNANSQALRAKR